MNKEPPERTPPYSEEVEAAVLGCALLDPEAAKVVSALDTDSFYDTRHREIHAALKKLNGESNLVSLHLALKASNRLMEAGGDVYIASLPDKTPSAANLPVHLEDLNNFAVRRAALRDAGEVERIAWDDSSPADAVADASARLLKAHAALSSHDHPLSVRSADELVNMTFPVDDNFMGDRLLARGQSFVIVGAGGIGKSRILLQLAASCILERDFCGLETHHCKGSRWLIIQAENSNRRIHNDFLYLKDWLKEDWKKVSDCLTLHTLESDQDSILSLSFPDTEPRLTQLVVSGCYDVVVFDPLKDFGYGDLNTDADMIATCHALSRISKTRNHDRLLGIVHHAITGKAGAAKALGFDRASFGRNSKVLHSWTRSQINVAPGTEDYSTLVVSCGKCSNGKEFAPFAITMDTSTMIYSLDPHFNLDDWKSDMAGDSKTKQVMPPARVRELCRLPMSKHELVKAIQDDCFCSKASAYRYLDLAHSKGLLVHSKSTGQYVAK